MKMGEEKEISSYDDSCSRSSNEDSLLSASNSPNIISPLSSTTALSVTGYSVESDEGVDMTIGDDNGVDLCKKTLFGISEKKLFSGSSEYPTTVVRNEDLPLDLSMKRTVTHSTDGRIGERVGIERESKEGRRNRLQSGNLNIDEDCDEAESSSKFSSQVDTENKSLRNHHHSLVGSKYFPWLGIRGSSSLTLPFSHGSASLWHPGLIMSHPTMGLQMKPEDPAQALGSFFPYRFAAAHDTVAAMRNLADGGFAVPHSTEQANHAMPLIRGIKPFMFGAAHRSMSAIHDHNVLGDFSRICDKAKHVYGKHVLVDSLESPKRERSVAYEPKVSPNSDRKRISPTESRKRKLLESTFYQAEFNDEEMLISPPSKRMFREEKTDRIFDHRFTGDASRPSLLSPNNEELNSMNQKQQIESRGRPQPVDFKPCRFHCDECGRTYATAGGLLKHAKSHRDPENAKTFTCKTCEKEYTSLGALKMHIRTHTLPCKCHICGKAFSRTWLLQGHIRTHTGEKPYQCSICLRAFADRSNLRAHMQTHETVKRYACTNCDKTFSRISLLNRHHASGCLPSPTS